jgi:hypothetical protein
LKQSFSASPFRTAAIASSIAGQIGLERIEIRQTQPDQRFGLDTRIQAQREIVDRAQAAIVENGRHLRLDVKAEIFQRGNRVGQRQAAFGLIELEAQGFGIAALPPIKAGAALARFAMLALALGMRAQSA